MPEAPSAVRRASGADIATVGDVLAAAYDDDTVINWFVRQDGRRRDAKAVPQPHGHGAARQRARAAIRGPRGHVAKSAQRGRGVAWSTQSRSQRSAIRSGRRRRAAGGGVSPPSSTRSTRGACRARRSHSVARGRLAGMPSFGEATQGGTRKPVSDETLYCFYSVSKGVSASMAWALIEEGRLRAEERIGEIVPALAEAPLAGGHC